MPTLAATPSREQKDASISSGSLFTGADDEKVLRVPSVPGSKAPEYCLAQQYSGLGNDALPADCKFPRGQWAHGYDEEEYAHPTLPSLALNGPQVVSTTAT
jgi:hypothetical protein